MRKKVLATLRSFQPNVAKAMPTAVLTTTLVTSHENSHFM